MYIIQRVSLFVLAGLILNPLIALAGNGGNEIAAWLSSYQPVAFDKMMENVSAKGAAPGSIVASPSKSNPDYFYHWVRDAGLVMDTIVTRYANSTDVEEKQRLNHVFFDQINFNKGLQSRPNPSGNVGEPKFWPDGSAYNVPWSRPQNDSPAIRALSFIHLANVWMKEGHESWVRQYLYDGSPTSLIKTDLEYVSHHWQDVCYDLWEETVGHHFFTEMEQRRALIEGASLARLLGDSGAADWYEAQAQQLEQRIESHWDPKAQILRATLDHPAHQGIDYKDSGLDSGTILGIIHGAMNDGFMAASDERVLSTAIRMENAFRNLYAINSNGVPGVAIGRYPEDRYSGMGTPEGSPWFLATNAFGEFYYDVASELKRAGVILVTSTNFSFYNALGIKGLTPGQMIPKADGLFASVVNALIAKGDDFITRSRYHMGHDGNVSEQFNRDTGFMQSAPNLTWSFASFVTAADARLRVSAIR